MRTYFCILSADGMKRKRKNMYNTSYSNAHISKNKQTKKSKNKPKKGTTAVRDRKRTYNSKLVCSLKLETHFESCGWLFLGSGVLYRVCDVAVEGHRSVAPLSIALLAIGEVRTFRPKYFFFFWRDSFYGYSSPAWGQTAWNLTVVCPPNGTAVLPDKGQAHERCRTAAQKDLGIYFTLIPGKLCLNRDLTAVLKGLSLEYQCERFTVLGAMHLLTGRLETARRVALSAFFVDAGCRLLHIYWYTKSLRSCT